MSLFGVLTVVFVVLKLTGVISWSWLLVLLPLLPVIIMQIISMIFIHQASRKIKKSSSKW
ncbi:transmembrane Fragile-X-F protein [Bacillus safensis]|uniref:transmembrane Fragile-X-F protein n=1 Tax=Bacillus safensis TaxID=561879 RepID=UPI0021E53311|nr:transmembrane Fragile-X-F protein [Bacillus safensis]UXO88851.1 transmembrane Fragile-X-F protein [Bacillus safensis]